MAPASAAFLSPPPSQQQQHQSAKSSPSAGSKRKRADRNQDASLSNASRSLRTPGLSPKPDSALSGFCKALLAVLESHDASSSILTADLQNKSTDDASEPESKRQRLTAATTISSKLASTSYTKLSDIADDIISVCTDYITNATKIPSSKSYPPRPHIVNSEQRRLISATQAFQATACALIRTEELRLERLPKSTKLSSIEVPSLSHIGDNELAEVKDDENDLQSPQNTTDKLEPYKELRDEENKGQGQVLELMGPSQTAGFACLKSLPARGLSALSVQMTLPTGVSSSTRQLKESAPSEVPTIGDAFGTDRLETIPFPPQSRHTSTKSSEVGWYHPDTADFISNRGPTLSYASERLITGQWLDYNISPNSPQSASPEAKQRHRARTLSSGDARSAVPKETVAAHERDKQEALFRRAYSSFAPVQDDAGAVVPTAVKNQMWSLIGSQRRFNQDSNSSTFTEDAKLGLDTADGPIANAIDDFDFAEAVESWDPNLPIDEFQPQTKSKEDMDNDELLQETANLLETLHSFQQIRNLSLSAQSATQSDSSAESSSKTPSEEELATYEILRDQLTLFIAALPPYAVSKLKGDQLSSLRISHPITTQTPVYKGTLELEDNPSRQPLNNRNPSARLLNTPSVPYTPRPAFQSRPSALLSPDLHRRPTPTMPRSVPPSTPARPPIQARANLSSYSTNAYALVNGARQSQYTQPSNPSAYYPTRPASSYSTTPSQPGYAQRAQAALSNQLRQQQVGQTPGQTAGFTPQIAQNVSPPKPFVSPFGLNNGIPASGTQPSFNPSSRGLYATPAPPLSPQQQIKLSPSPALGQSESLGGSPVPRAHSEMEGSPQQQGGDAMITEAG
ncbi:MAG: hypothetical protein M1814_004121 [Vezdaea aestivalis]|nr:MAG: hypothetical protein M1814_004121 [Vezdaea aestivalis]